MTARGQAGFVGELGSLGECNGRRSQELTVSHTSKFEEKDCKLISL